MKPRCYQAHTALQNTGLQGLNNNSETGAGTIELLHTTVWLVSLYRSVCCPINTETFIRQPDNNNCQTNRQFIITILYLYICRRRHHKNVGKGDTYNTEADSALRGEDEKKSACIGCLDDYERRWFDLLQRETPSQRHTSDEGDYTSDLLVSVTDKIVLTNCQWKSLLANLECITGSEGHWERR